MRLPSEKPTFGFIGFGQVGAAFAERLEQHGVSVCAYDRNIERPAGIEKLRARTKASSVAFLPIEEVLAVSTVILSIVPPEQALIVAQMVQPYLGPDKTFIDANSVSPRVKREIADLVTKASGTYLEAAILDAVGTAGANARIIFSGEKAEGVMEFLRALGFRITYLGKGIGQAARLKMLRSIWSKGFEALLIESLAVAKKAGLDQELWSTLDDIGGPQFGAAAQNWICTHPFACKRRFHEMQYVVETIREMGLDPILSAAVMSFFGRSSTFGLAEEVANRPTDPRNTINVIASHL